MNFNVVSIVGIFYSDGCIWYYGFDMKNQMKQASIEQCYETLMQFENISIDKIWPIYVQVGSQLFNIIFFSNFNLTRKIYHIFRCFKIGFNKVCFFHQLKIEYKYKGGVGINFNTLYIKKIAYFIFTNKKKNSKCNRIYCIQQLFMFHLI
jgi:hypothetical protein